MSFGAILKRFDKKLYKFGKLDLLVLAVGLAIFVSISMATISQSSIWFDEAFSAYIIRFNFAEIWGFTAVDVHPPLYYWLLKVWSVIFGTTDVALRSMSVFFAGVAIVFAYLILQRSFGRKAAVYGLLVVALSPILLRYSQEMRMYTLVLAIVLAATYVLQRAEAAGRRRLWVVYGVLVSLGMWTHYFAAIAWLAHWVWRVFATVRGGKFLSKKHLKAIFTKDWIVTHVVAIGLFLPWLPYLVKQLFVVQTFGFWIPPVSPVTVTDFFTNSVLYLNQSGLTPWLTLGFIFLVVLTVWLSVGGYKRLSKIQKTAYWLVLSLAFVPPSLLIITSMPPLQSSFVDRYLVVSSVAVSLLLGLAMWFSTQHKKRIVTIVAHVVIIGVSVVGISSVYYYGNHNKTTGESSGAKQVMNQIFELAKPSEPVVAASMWTYYDTVFYETDEHKVWFIDPEVYEYGSLEMLRTRDYGKIYDMSEFARNNQTFWYVGRVGDSKLDPPIDSLKKVQELSQPDPFTGKPAYKAVQYQVISE